MTRFVDLRITAYDLVNELLDSPAHTAVVYPMDKRNEFFLCVMKVSKRSTRRGEHHFVFSWGLGDATSDEEIKTWDASFPLLGMYSYMTSVLEAYME